MTRPSIAVIVPNRNHAKFLPRCLRSVLEQNVPPEELIVVDDQSQDESVAVVRSFIKDCDWAQLVVNPVNLGTNGALNEGLKRVSSEYVLFLASNDFVLPGIFERAKAGLAATPRVALWSAMAWMVDENDRPIRLHPSAVVSMRDARLTPARCIELAHKYGNWFTGTSAIYHRDTLREVGGFDPEYGAPSDLIMALTVSSLKGAAYSPEALCAIRIHKNSYSSRALSDPAGLEKMIARLRTEGPRRSPALFTVKFLERTALRYQFAAVRAAAGDARTIEPYVRPSSRAMLTCVDRMVPRSWRAPRIVLAFLILRPFDVLPTVLNRFIPWIIARARSRLPS